MTSVGEWVAGARPRTLPAAVSPVLVGTGAAAYADGVVPGKAVLALVLALSLQIGVNYANDYSDGVRGTDAARVGPLRLVGSGTASARAVRAAALAALTVAAVTGATLAATSGWWLLAVGAACLAAAWTYTGGPNPYGYRAFGEVAVFIFFGLVAVLGTTYVQLGSITQPAVAGAVGVGALACAILVANNLRDIPTDARSGKQTLAVVLGDRRTRWLYAVLVAISVGCLTWLAVLSPWTLLGAAFLLPAARALAVVLGGAGGARLVPVLPDTGLAQLVYSAGIALGLALSG